MGAIPAGMNTVANAEMSSLSQHASLSTLLDPTCQWKKLPSKQARPNQFFIGTSTTNKDSSKRWRKPPSISWRQNLNAPAQRPAHRMTGCTPWSWRTCSWQTHHPTSITFRLRFPPAPQFSQKIWPSFSNVLWNGMHRPLEIRRCPITGLVLRSDSSVLPVKNGLQHKIIPIDHKLNS